MISEVEALNTAIERERGAYRLYSEAASRTADGKGKQLFSWLASEEQGHIKLLQLECDSVDKGEGWLSEGDIDSCGGLTSPIERGEFPDLSEVREAIDAEAPEAEVLARAVKAEQEAASFYSDLARSIPTAEGLFTKLADIERGHLELLEEELEWLRRSREFFTVHRFTLPSSA